MRNRKPNPHSWTVIGPQITALKDELADCKEQMQFMREDWKNVGDALGFNRHADPEDVLPAIAKLNHKRDLFAGSVLTLSQVERYLAANADSDLATTLLDNVRASLASAAAAYTPARPFTHG